MSAVLQAVSADGIEVTRSLPGQESLLTPAALAFLAGLHRRFEPARQQRLAARRERQAEFDAGAVPGFRADTAHLRNADWRVADLPAALLDRRVEITGPVDPKMVINALNSGANCYMADFEDSTSPTWENLLTGQRALRKAIAGTLDWMAPDGSRHYVLKPFAEQAVLLVRPRGWHLDEKHVLVDGERMSASPVRPRPVRLPQRRSRWRSSDRGPYFYLPKLQSMEEAALWDEVLAHIEATLGLPPGQIKVTVLIETLAGGVRDGRDPARAAHAHRRSQLRALGLHLFVHQDLPRASRQGAAGTRAGGMTQPFLKAYSELLIHTCHKRGAHAMGGMAAQIPIAGDDTPTNARSPASAPTRSAKSAPATTAPGSRIRR